MTRAISSGIIGYTGFVGGNLVRQIAFSRQYNSKTIAQIRGQEFDLLVCAGIRSEKWKANQNPVQDLADVQSLLDALAAVRAKQFVLISTVDVYPRPWDVNERTAIKPQTLNPYGKHRLLAETFVQAHFPRHVILRLPALFGSGLKKNFIYDLLHPEPKIIVPQKFREIIQSLSGDAARLVRLHYQADTQGNYRLADNLEEPVLAEIRAALGRAGFTSLDFTDGDSEFQFYDLLCLGADLQRAGQNSMDILNISSEPLKAADVAKIVFNRDFQNKTGKPPLKYDVHSLYFRQWGGRSGYLYRREQILERLQAFARNRQP